MDSKKITKYEKVRIIGTRANQLALGAPAAVEIDDLNNVIKIAEKEYVLKKIPLVICRQLPNGKKIEIPFSEIDTS